MRQYRKKRSTWSVGAVGLVLVVIVLLFYIEAMSAGIDSWDNDGDGLIDEDPSDWDGSQAKSVGDVDDDGDCWSRESFDRDWNGDGIDCNVIYNYDRNGMLTSVNADPNVDEDPNESEFLEESMHRSFLLGFGKFGFLFVMGIFIPLFLATGLIRDEQEAGTLHYLVGKPIARAEILMYRLLGFIGLAWPYFLGLIFLSALVTGFFGPGDSIYRFSDLGIWFGVLIATFLTVLAYAAIFASFGIIAPRFGVLLALLFAVWEFFMMFLAMFETTRQMGIASLSVSFWGAEIINSTGWLVWDDYALMYGQAESIGFFAEIALWTVWFDPFPTTTPLLNLVISIVVLLMIVAMFVLIGQSSFKKRELN
jgi:ABC-type transport system involved in multi-copper enzyme maturation permease subunit|tara:strand:- start:70 stop:1164 length:1095 start_codon:yes stop_codon:yes gene_type:complete